MAKYNQTQKAKEEFKSPLLDILMNKPNFLFKKEELMAMTGWNERKVRAEIEKIANYYPIYASAGRKGYGIMHFDDNYDLEIIKGLNQAAFDEMCELQHRVDSIKARMKPLIAFMRTTAVKLQEKGEKNEQYE